MDGPGVALTCGLTSLTRARTGGLGDTIAFGHPGRSWLGQSDTTFSPPCSRCSPCHPERREKAPPCFPFSLHPDLWEIPFAVICAAIPFFFWNFVSLIVYTSMMFQARRGASDLDELVFRQWHRARALLLSGCMSWGIEKTILEQIIRGLGHRFVVQSLRVAHNATRSRPCASYIYIYI